MDNKMIIGILIAVVGVMGILVIALPSLNQPTGVETVYVTVTPVPTENGASAKPQGGDSSCDMCHADADREQLHIDGGQLCAQCHGGANGNVHEIHPTQSCNDCHAGTQPTIPKAEEGHTVCENCHGYPDASKPSYGNLVDIHIPRGVGCTVCHTGPISEIHKSG
ncbi:MAG: hypothetical protein SVJ22_07485 [Halobacteriota archaeon]|nr:hypothetical protein [Halobacteriota archaeon]